MSWTVCRRQLRSWASRLCEVLTCLSAGGKLGPPWDVLVGEVGKCLGERAELVFTYLQLANFPLCCPSLTGCRFWSAWGEGKDRSLSVVGQAI